ncbi:GTP 3',8-cyclase MoaA [Luminiphilus sp.]|jgi:cyclic pyranopterin phosphate synthase|nr:GTP 3',8-cyclase MoaA [Luminiphilus sp.]MBT6350621.1 GTP 3',8-cyclase MoaA [Halieaceae bacterium]MBL6897077.1 GTP 3',8-cyclase MoaA [Luminiphilus sp.]MCH1579283.1 GTP 3',8-cyclase MoaA [Luminiphilus sp.]MDA8555079.1 GTP 3',8-cyclase MoaA [Luminiphilus sp.]
MPDSQLIDGFGRKISYLRLSITDRCDFRCQYCMAETMQFLPRSEVLTIEELLRVARIFTELGVRKIRVTGGEPLVRKGAGDLFMGLGALPGLQTLAVTTNGSQLPSTAQSLKDAGVRSLNISLDSLHPARFRDITRVGDLQVVLRGIDAAVAAGFERIRLNAVVLDGLNRDEVLSLTQFAIEKRIHIAFIEEMPLGQVTVGGKALAYVSSETLLEELGNHYSLEPLVSDDIAGPSRDFRISGTETELGFISPHSHNFCSSCNRLRISAEGRLLMCLGNEESIDLRALLRSGDSDERIKSTIIDSLVLKPERHVFDRPEEPQIVRFMNATGG